ncbi:MAG: preprotein translocase subunit SecG [Firmicutes bacterium]|nr:preprotein translocase subunit SecG [Bacillota bacterium]
MKIALLVILALISVVLVLVVMLQQGESSGLTALGGGSDSSFGKKKSKGYDDKLSRLTVIAAIAFLIVNLILVVIM